MGWEFLHGLKPFFGMIFVQMFFAGVNIFYKLAINDGMDLRILVAYRYLFAAALLAPLAFFIERKTRPSLTWMILLQAFGCGLFGGTLCQNLYIASLTLTSATFTAAMTNLIPAITFVMALVFRMERLRFATVMGKAKMVGTLTGIGGAMLLTFYKGAEIDIWPSSLRVNLVRHHGHADHHLHTAVESGNRVMGSLLAIASCFSYAIWLIIQAKMSEAYPSLSSTALMCLMGSIQAVVFALLMDTNRTSWTLGWNIRLLTVFYAGVLGTGLCFTLVSWCVKKKGPLFASIFNPLMLVMVALAGSLLLDERIHLGSVLGAILIVMGLYLVLWGKGKDIEESVHMPLKNNNPVSAAKGLTDEVTVIVTEACDEATLNSLNGANHSELEGEDFITEMRDNGTGENVRDSGRSEATSLPAKETQFCFQHF